MRTADFPFDFKLDPYEQALEDELERLDQEGLLVIRKATPEERAMYHQASVNTRKALREGKRWMVEHRSKYANSSEELMSWLSPAAQEKLKQQLKDKKNPSQENKTLSSTTKGSKLSLTSSL